MTPTIKSQRVTLYPLVYVCKYCGEETARFDGVPSHEPATLTVCGKPKCRAEASADYNRR